MVGKFSCKKTRTLLSLNHSVGTLHWFEYKIFFYTTSKDTFTFFQNNTYAYIFSANFFPPPNRYLWAIIHRHARLYGAREKTKRELRFKTPFAFVSQALAYFSPLFYNIIFIFHLCPIQVHIRASILFVLFIVEGVFRESFPRNGPSA